MIRLQHANARLPIDGCAVVPAKPNPDARGCLYEIYRAEWPGTFPTVQWNACVSKAGVVRGVHVHVDYQEYYTLLAGRGLLGIHDIRCDSPTFGRSATIDWRAEDRCAVTIPCGVAHVLWFIEDSVLAFGLSSYWSAALDVVGCRWDDPALGFEIPEGAKSLSERDDESGSYAEMVQNYESLVAQHAKQTAVI
ncbi:MAG TPA: dTDP-4-dehydrorhamnose 3,5-epimerase family protein [Chthoniobacterales bacterium]|nr:dTDP-4-dehydrorhamnose 3,5-epimerase family protein [Chthoniobacterales bacterium]